MTDPTFRVRALGEIAIRCRNMPLMVAFYRDVIGLEVLRGGPNSPITFFRIGPGFGGHTQVLALFDAIKGPRPAPQRSAPSTPESSTLHHIALSLHYEELEAAAKWYDKIGQPHHIEEFEWVGWRGLFTKDPEGNIVELVAFDPDLLKDQDG